MHRSLFYLSENIIQEKYILNVFGLIFRVAKHVNQPLRSIIQGGNSIRIIWSNLKTKETFSFLHIYGSYITCCTLVSIIGSLNEFVIKIVRAWGEVVLPFLQYLGIKAIFRSWFPILALFCHLLAFLNLSFIIC